MSRVGSVAIGRNEGDRLRACLESLRLVASAPALALSPSLPAVSAIRYPQSALELDFLRPPVSAIRNPQSALPLVYVDSGSTDGSVALATSRGAEVVELDMSRPFSAARARNEGFARLREIAPAVEYVQFVDGDCAVAAGWLNVAKAFLDEHQAYAVVCGRRRERFPEASVYDRLCDMEWDTPVGDARACGGDAMMRVAALAAVGGYDAAVIAGEEPELCVRLRQAGWKIHRLKGEMTLHDAAMTRFGQWWRRSVRGGYAYALGASMHGKPPERHWVRETRSINIWGICLPLLILALAWPTNGLSLVLAAGYFVLGFRVYRHMRGRGFSAGDSRLYAFFCVLAKFPQAQGQLRFWWGGLTARPSGIIEYKTSAAKPVTLPANLNA